MTPPISHSDACRLAMLLVSAHGCGMVTQRPVGIFYDERGTPRRIGVPGEADVQATAPDGRSVAIEIKAGKFARRSAQQKAWAERFIQLGGVYCCARFTATEDGAHTIREMFRLAGYSERTKS